MDQKSVFSKEGSTMNEKYLIGKGGVRPYITDGRTAGFEFGIKIPYYMGVPLSQIDHIRIWLDGEEVPQEDLRLIMDTGEIFTRDEITTVATYFWEYGSELRTVVLRESPLEPGEHRLDIAVGIAVFYFPKGTTNRAHLDFTV